MMSNRYNQYPYECYFKMSNVTEGGPLSRTAQALHLDQWLLCLAFYMIINCNFLYVGIGHCIYMMNFVKL